MHALNALQSLILSAEEAAAHAAEHAGAMAGAAAEHAAEHGEHVEALTRQVTHPAGFLWLIPFLPLLGSAINAMFGLRLQRRFGKAITSHIAIGAMTLSFLTAAFAWIQLIGLPEGERYLLNDLWTLISAGDVQVQFSFALDPLSMMMTLIITFIGTLIHVYSVGYMADEPAYWRFFCYLNLFVFSMLLLVMGDNFVLMFFGWEGVGLCSYLLIGFWYEDVEKARAAVKAFVTNRFGDFGFVLGLFLLFWAMGGAWQKVANVVPDREVRWAKADANYQVQAESGTVYLRDPTIPVEQGRTEAGTRVGPTLTFRDLRDQLTLTSMKERLLGMNFAGIPLLALVGILLFVGATAKSAQIPLYVWLPDAMAGPTPVSALIHAATMVTAGVYMVARLNFLFALSPTAMTVIAVTGAATAAFAATIGFVQYDIKKVLAYSTVSQLGFMFIGVGVGAYWAGAYHLLTHAFFKACLFLGSGSVILGCHHEQDMRKMGGLKKFMPLTEKTYRYACIAIAGFPIANGFFSKDEILWKAFTSGSNMLDPAIGKIIWTVGWLTALGTSFYMWRSYYMTFTGEYRGGHDDHGHAHAAPATAPAPAGSHVASHDAIKHGPEDVAHGGKDDHGHAPAPAHATAHAKADHADHPDHKAEGGHGHGGSPHESPNSMTWVLATLAIGCAATIVLGFWPVLGHWVPALEEPILERWLAPVLAPSHAMVAARAMAEPGLGLEILLIAASVSVAFGGWGVARALYKDAKSTVPERVKAALPGLHRWMYNKYYVDELYQAVVLKPAYLLARAWSAFDAVVVDGLVNGIAAVGRFVCNIDGAIDTYIVDGFVNLFANNLLRLSKSLRRIQTGRIQHYLYAALAGALLVVGINYLFG
ncbi:MAG TPA: proton-conducting transporter membrane subunit [Myxococcaceae bacterium]|nr:proton-conducting transporter membrane subunit [Myxococcaceae bacterium]